MKIKNTILVVVAVTLLASCDKLVQVDPPTNTIVSEQAFSNDHNANTSVNGIYSKLINQSQSAHFGNGAVSMIVGLASDETTFFGTEQSLTAVYTNEMTPNAEFPGIIWKDAYAVIYTANACLEQLQGNSKITPALRSRLIGEAKFLRAYCYFYLVNIFGDVPYLTTSDYKANSLASRTNFSEIYSSIINDLETSVNDLPDNYDPYNGERIRATKWAALALLSRLYLYIGQWDKASSDASMVIGNGNFELLSQLDNVFLKNSKEAIFQLSIDGTLSSTYNVVPEASLTIPFDRTTNPLFYLPNSFLGEFDSNDERRIHWVDSTVYSGTVYYIPYKYKVGVAQMAVNGAPTEYYMVLRLAEQYLIRAEARARKGDLSGAAQDINVIRARANLSPISFSSLDDAIDKILEERKKEFFYEWGNRWFDLKRTGKIDSIMNVVTPQKGGTWLITDKLFPIPAEEVLLNHNLKQNPGY